MATFLNSAADSSFTSKAPTAAVRVVSSLQHKLIVLQLTEKCRNETGERALSYYMERAGSKRNKHEKHKEKKLTNKSAVLDNMNIGEST